MSATSTFASMKTQNTTSSSSVMIVENDLSFAMTPNTVYGFEAYITVQTSGILPIYTWTVTGMTGVSNFIFTQEVIGSSLSTLIINSLSTPTSITGLLTRFAIRICGTISNPNQDSEFNFNFSNTGGGTVTNTAGSFIRYTFPVS